MHKKIDGLYFRWFLFVLFMFSRWGNAYPHWGTTSDGFEYYFDSTTKEAVLSEFLGNKLSLKTLVVPTTVVLYDLWDDYGHSLGGSAKCEVVGISNILSFKDCKNIETISISANIKYLGKDVFYGLKELKTVSLPNTIETIDMRAFQDCENLESVTIPESLRIIKSQAFMNCGNLTSFSFNSNIVSIESEAFKGCKKLEVNSIPNSVTSIGQSAFEGCMGLKDLSIGIGKGTMKIGRFAFIGSGIENLHLGSAISEIGEKCFSTEKLQNVEIDDGIEKIGIYAFSGSSIKSLVIPNSVESIETGAFYGCKELEMIKIGEGLHLLGGSAFSGCTSLVDIQLGNHVNHISSSTFSNCTLLKVIVIPTSVCAIDYSAFSNCSNLTKVIIKGGENALKIGNNAFRLCSNIDTLTIGNGVSEIGECSFEGCSKLQELVIPNSVMYIGKNAFHNCSNLRKLKIGSGEGKTVIDRLAFDGCLELEALNIGSVEEIGDRTFQNCKKLKSLIFVEGLKKISQNAFSGCLSLGKLEIPESVLEIEESAFYGCRSITSIICASGENDLNIGKNAFYGCEKLETLELGNRVSYIGQGAFYNCKALTSLSLGDKGRELSIGATSFYGCTSLEKLVIGDGVSTIESQTFLGCSKLKELKIGKNVKSIGSRSFWLGSSIISFPDNEVMEELVIPGNVKEIGAGAFRAFTFLKRLKIEDGVEKIGKGAFEWCARLETLYLSKDLKEIGDNAFYECQKIKELQFRGNSLKIIGKSTFDGCKSLETLVIPHSVTQIGEYSFARCESLSFLQLSKNLSEIPISAFTGCKKLLKLKIPERIESIGDNAFCDCISLTELYVDTDFGELNGFPNTTIGANAFANCYSLKRLTLGEHVKSIGTSAFRNCSSLPWLSIPGSVKVVESEAFFGCSSLEELSVSCAKVSSSAFEGCRKLNSLFIGGNVNEIGEKAFYNCTALNIINCYVTHPIDIDKSTFSYTYINPTVQGAVCFNSNPILYVPEASQQEYAQHEVWGLFNQNRQLPIVRYEGLKGIVDVPEGKGWEIEGVTADGCSKLYFLFDKDVQSIDSWDVSYLIDNKTFNADYSHLTGTIRLTRENDNYLFLYEAPVDFPDTDKFYGKNNYVVIVKLTIKADGIQSEYYTHITVMRPGILLLHGLASSNECFRDLRDFLENSGYLRNQLNNFDYSDSSTQPFNDNIDKVEIGVEEIYLNLLKSGIISSRYDVVAHSMGGILTRLFVQKLKGEDKFVPINSIITLDTPHSGSQGATLLINEGVSFLNDIIAIGVSPDKFRKLRSRINDIKGTAVMDLAPSSKAMQLLNSPNNLKKESEVPSHAICSYMTYNEDWDEARNGFFTWDKWDWLTGVLAQLVYTISNDVTSDQQFLDRVLFKDDIGHDGVVCYKSQRGGKIGSSKTDLKDIYDGPFGFYSNAHHCKTNKWKDTYDSIFVLLQRPKESLSFRKGFAPEPINDYVSTSKTNSRKKGRRINSTGDNFMRLTLEKSDTKRALDVHIEKKEGIKKLLCISFLDDDNMLLGCHNYDYSFSIPDTYGGNLVVYAVGVTEKNDYVIVTDSITYDYDALLYYMCFEKHDTVHIKAGENISCRVVGGWSNGEETHLQPGYSTSDEEILVINGQDIIGNKSGTCMLYATQMGLTDSICVVVHPAPIIEFADAEVKRICVDNWDINGDGELSYAEATAVTDIGDVFKGNKLITSFNELKYFESVEVIGQRAFESCSELQSISMPRNIRQLGDSPFVYCNKLLFVDVTDLTNWCSITMSNGNSTPFKNGCHLYVDGEEIVNLVIPDNVTYVSKWAFSKCSFIETVQFPMSLKTIEWGAFSYCSNLKSLTIPKSVTFINNYAFHKCASLESFVLPMSVTRLGGNVLSSCSNLLSISVEDGNPTYDSRNNCNAIIERETNTLLSGCKNTVIPNDIKHLGNSVFSHCEELDSIVIPDNVESLGHSVFSYTKLTTLVIPENVIEIPSSMCWECSRLRSIELPAGITSINSTAFYRCPLLTVKAKMIIPTPISEETFTNRANAVLFVPSGSKAAYETADYWKEFKEIVEYDSETTMLNHISKADKNKIDVIYDINGRKNPMKHKGIYIKNKEKILFR